MTFPNGGRFRILSAVLMILVGHACLGWLETRERDRREEALRRQELSIVSAVLDVAPAAGGTRPAEVPAAAVALLEARGARGIAVIVSPVPGEGKIAVTAQWPASAAGSALDIAAILAICAAAALVIVALAGRAGSPARGSAVLVGIVMLPLAAAQLALIVVDAGQSEVANQRRIALIEWGLAEVFDRRGDGSREAAASLLLERALVAVPSLLVLDLRSPTGAPLAVARRAAGLAEAPATPLRRALVTGHGRPVHTADLTVEFARSLDPSGRIATVLTASGLALVLGIVAACLAHGGRRGAGARSGLSKGNAASCAAVALLAGATGVVAAVAESAWPVAGLATASALAGMAAGLLFCSQNLVGRPWRGLTFAAAFAMVATAGLATVMGPPFAVAGPIAMGVACGAMLAGLQTWLVAARRQAGLWYGLGRLWVPAAVAAAGGMIVAGLAEPGAPAVRWGALGCGLAGVLALVGVPGGRQAPLQLLVRSIRMRAGVAAATPSRLIAVGAASVLGCAATLAVTGSPTAVPALLCGIMLQPALSGAGVRAGGGEAGFWMVAAPGLVVAIPALGMPGGLAFPIVALLVGIGLGRLVAASTPMLVEPMAARPLDRGARLGREAGFLAAGSAAMAAACAVLAAWSG